MQINYWQDVGSICRFLCLGHGTQGSQSGNFHQVLSTTLLNIYILPKQFTTELRLACIALVRKPDSSLFQQSPSHSFPLALSLTSKDAGLFEARACLFDFLYPENHTKPHNGKKYIFFFWCCRRRVCSLLWFSAFLLWTSKFCVTSAASTNQGRNASETRCSAKQTQRYFFALLDIESSSKMFIIKTLYHWRKPRPTEPGFYSSPPNLELTRWLRVTHTMCHEVG